MKNFQLTDATKRNFAIIAETAEAAAKYFEENLRYTTVLGTVYDHCTIYQGTANEQTRAVKVTEVAKFGKYAKPIQA